MQLNIDFTNRCENNQESNKILRENSDHINGQCGKVLELLKSGKSLTVRGAMIDYGISSLPRRILDLKEHGFEIRDRVINKRFKEWFIER
jgi:hypothetical protein